MSEETIEKMIVEIERVPDIPNLIFRKFLGEIDILDIARINNAAARRDEVEIVQTIEELSNHYRNLRNCDPNEDIIVAEVDGQMVGHGRVWWSKLSDTGAIIYAHYATLDPDWRGRGIAAPMHNWLEDRAYRIAENHHPETEKWLGSEYAESQTFTKTLFEMRDFEPVRYAYEMRRDLSKPMPDAPMPAGLEIRPVEASHYRKIFDAKNEAFRDHWGHIEKTEEDYRRMVKQIEDELPGNQPHLWMVAWEGDKVAGMVLNGIFHEENKALGVKYGWTEPICVRRPWRKRGLARALIRESMEMLIEKGLAHAALGVDVENSNGALNLYTSCGFKTVKKWITVQKKMEI